MSAETSKSAPVPLLVLGDPERNASVIASLKEPITEGQLVSWHRAYGGQKQHAFTQDPGAKFSRHVALCSEKVRPNSRGSTILVPECPACRRALTFLLYVANRSMERGRTAGHGIARLGGQL